MRAPMPLMLPSPPRAHLLSHLRRIPLHHPIHQQLLQPPLRPGARTIRTRRIPIRFRVPARRTPLPARNGTACADTTRHLGSGPHTRPVIVGVRIRAARARLEEGIDIAAGVTPGGFIRRPRRGIQPWILGPAGTCGVFLYLPRLAAVAEQVLVAACDGAPAGTDYGDGVAQDVGYVEVIRGVDFHDRAAGAADGDLALETGEVHAGA